MSTIVAVKKNQQVCIAADTLTCLGNTKESGKYIENPSKIIRLGDTYIASVGHASWNLVLRNYFQNPNRKAAFHDADAIFDTLIEMHRVLKERYFLNPKEDDEGDAFESSQLDALVANPNGIFGIYSVRSVQEYTRFYARGTGAHYALGAMYAAYETAGSAEDIARVGIHASAEFDDATALPMDCFTINLHQPEPPALSRKKGLRPPPARS